MQKGMSIFWCTAPLGTFPALASHSLICPGIALLPLTPRSVLPRLCLQLSCCQPVSEKCEYIRVCCCQAENSSDGAFPRTNPGYDDAIDCSLHFSPTPSFFLTTTKNTKLNTPSLLSCRKGQVSFYNILWFTLSFLCRVCYSLLHSAAQIPSRQRPKLCFCSYFYWLDISVDYCTVVSTIAPDLHQPQRDQSLAQCLQSLLKLVSQGNTSIKSCFEGTER